MNTSTHLNHLISSGNSNLLVLRNAIVSNTDCKEVELFNALTCLSQIEGDLMKDQKESEQTLIEKNFFKLSLKEGKYENMFHYGGMTSMVVVSNSKNIQK